MKIQVGWNINLMISIIILIFVAGCIPPRHKDEKTNSNPTDTATPTPTASANPEPTSTPVVILEPSLHCQILNRWYLHWLRLVSDMEILHQNDEDQFNQALILGLVSAKDHSALDSSDEKSWEIILSQFRIQSQSEVKLISFDELAMKLEKRNFFKK